MRFVLDELYSDEESSLDLGVGSDSDSSNDPDYSNVADPHDLYSPKLRIPKKKDVPTKTRTAKEEEVTLLPEIARILEGKQFKSSVIAANTVPSVIHLSREEEQNTESLIDKRKDNKLAHSLAPDVNIEQMEAQFSKVMLGKLDSLETLNRKRIEEVRAEKKRIEEEQKRKLEEEKRRKEQEDKRLKEEAERAKKEQEKQEKERLAALEAEKKREQEEKAKKQAQAQEKDKAQKAVTDFDSISKTFWKYKAKIKSIKEEIVIPVKNADKELRNILSKHKRKINPKFGQLTNTFSQLQSIQNELSHLIDETKGQQLAYLWILNFIAKAIVHQAETEVRAKPESSVPLARLALYIMVRYPEFKELLLARFVKKCPFVIGFTCDIGTEEGRGNMGWKRDSSGKWEEPTSYNERIGAMVTLFSVITRLELPQEFIQTSNHPLPISHSWHLVARIANTPLKLIQDTHFVVLGSWWDAAAKEFLQAYGVQAAKLLQLVGDNLTSAVADRKYVGAARLRILLESWQENKLESFPEMVP
ncbi:related to Nucleoporin GLE1 [Nakaseomyces glabratus]|nr:GLE1-like protein [Nakaseomyces glabratus]QNG15290.1 uncharacterized protein GWK60_J09449 [Nakaseomyces glabratus]SCV12801.1 related to Nucleoporin GLE1 [Nakaseomyces glabratus]SLM10505.1 related to Nucleoporin GLE1 [Nakaseomyces glabratus]